MQYYSGQEYCRDETNEAVILVFSFKFRENNQRF